MLNLYLIEIYFKDRIKMANSNYENNQSQKSFGTNNNRSNFKNRYGSNREGGGFRIRLSDNEMSAVKRIQEYFQLKSTVAVLGFSVRTLSEIIKDEKFKEALDKISEINRNTQIKNNFPKKEETTHTNPDPFARPIKQEKENSKNIENGDEN